MTSQGTMMAAGGNAAGKFDDMTSQGSYMMKLGGGLGGDDMTSNASYMVKGSVRHDDMSS